MPERVIQLSNSCHGKTVHKRVPDLAPFEYFWRDQPAGDLSRIEASFLPLDLLAKLFTMIQVPYEDYKPTCWRSLDEYRHPVTQEKVVFPRTNHDALHGLRKALYLFFFMELLKLSGRSSMRRAACQLTPDEVSCFLLFAMMERAGRTNEYSSGSDPSNIKRSVEFFCIVAADLKFNPALVASMKKRFLHREPSIRCCSGFAARTVQEQQDKVRLFDFLAQITHHSDLYRCRKERFIDALIADELTPNLDDKRICPRVVVGASQRYIKQVIRMTGTRYSATKGRQRSSNVILKAAALDDPAAISRRLFLTCRTFLSSVQAAYTGAPRRLRFDLFHRVTGRAPQSQSAPRVVKRKREHESTDSKKRNKF